MMFVYLPHVNNVLVYIWYVKLRFILFSLTFRIRVKLKARLHFVLLHPLVMSCLSLPSMTDVVNGKNLPDMPNGENGNSAFFDAVDNPIVSID